tara:strand:- start:1386 stop:3404 length:2019 start_codon:yes stop_codon:yes gene_type:complete
MLYLDLETRSECDLIFHGLRRYAEDATTEVICMAYCFDDGEVFFWWSNETFPQIVSDYFKAGGPIMAHNAEFERHLVEWVMSNDHDFAPPKLEQWRCSLVIGLANGFAGGLAALAAGLGLPFNKHTEGTRLIREYCSPGHLKEFREGDADKMRAYNIADVEVMRAAVKCLRDPTDAEWKEYHLNCKINERGLPIDVAFCDAALAYTREVADDANRQISELTGGKMTKSTQRNARDTWLLPKLTAHQTELLEVYKAGVKKISLDQDHRHYLLGCEDLDTDARKLLEYIDNAGSSALKKFAVAAHQHVRGRVHNTFLWNGAGRTGRFAGKGLQPHNIRRDVFNNEKAESLIEDIGGGYEIERPADTMARLLRAMVYHPDGLYWVDYSSIEGRVAPWLSHSDDGEDKLDLFRANRDVYAVTAAKMLGIAEADVNDGQRQVGKIAELSLQFGGSHNALINMGKKYGAYFTEAEAKYVVDQWRVTNEWAQTIWGAYDTSIGKRYTRRTKATSKKTEQVYSGAIENPGVVQKVGRVSYFADPRRDFLWCSLPSGRLLAYPRPRMELITTPWGENCVAPTFQSHFKPAAGEPPIRIHARGALLFQNSVQAVAADCLREALLGADAEGLNIVGHVHDEIIGLGSQENGERLNDIMLRQPSWAAGLPIATGGVRHSKRWGK